MTTASLGWIDFSPAHRDRVGTVLDLLRPEGMVDELGMGIIRDALADQLFPGISTIQARARYFFFIPYILYDYLRLPPSKRSRKRPSEYLEQREYDLMWDLSDYYRELAHEQGVRHGFGVIGITRPRGKKIVRRPSAIYWNGMKTFGFMDNLGLGVDGFVNRVDGKNPADLLAQDKAADDESKEDAGALYTNAFRLRVPPPDADWSTDPRLDLTDQEAEFFKDRLLTSAGSRLLGALLKHKSLWSAFETAETFKDFACIAQNLDLAPPINDMIILAHDFSELMFGAHIFYNEMLQQKVHNSNWFTSDWEEWKSTFQDKMISYHSFDPAVLFHYAVTAPKSTRLFVEEWWRIAQGGFQDKSRIAALISQQESRAKGRKARLAFSKFDDVREEQWIGLRQFDYRFIQAKAILSDIKQL